MSYKIEFTSRSLKDLDSLDNATAKRIVKRINALQDGLIGDIKALVNFDYEYRLRVGDYRVLFDINTREMENGEVIVVIKVIVVQRVQHRKEVYR